MSPKQRARVNSLESLHQQDSGLLKESVLIPVFESLVWDLRTLCSLCAVNRKFQAVGKRVLWRHLCLHRAPKMVSSLTMSHTDLSSSALPSSSGSHRLLGGWVALAKLLFYCCGCDPSRNFGMNRSVMGHFCETTRFSKTSGSSFLSKRCRGDVLYVSDPCEHVMGSGEEDLMLGVYRGVFGEFMRSKTRAVLVGRHVGLEEERVRCPYCRARVWSMTGARMVPGTAWRRLGASRERHEVGDGCADGGGRSSLEYFVCINGHLYGACWLTPLSSDDDVEDEED